MATRSERQEFASTSAGCAPRRIQFFEWVGIARGRGRATVAAICWSGAVNDEAQLRGVNLSWIAVLIYLFLHAGCLGAFYTGLSAKAVLVLCGAFLLRGFGVSVVYHRYFAHRSFRTSRLMQFLLGLYGSLTVLGGPLWWAQTHREHHRHADTPNDIHSPYYQGFIYSHCGWFLDHKHRRIDSTKIRDLAQFPELLWLERLDLVFKLVYVAGCYWLFGILGVVWGFFLPAVIVLQMIHWIQSVSHSIGGYRRYPTSDDSRNHWLFGIISLGEGFHHNHHCFPSSARLGLRWWEFDAGYLLLVALSWLGLIWDLQVPREEVRGGHDKRADRHVAYIRAEIRNLANGLDAAISALESESSDCETLRAACRELKERVAHSLDAFAGRIRDLLVAGPFVLQQAYEELRHGLSQDARSTLAAAAEGARLNWVVERVNAMVCGLPATVRPAKVRMPP